jgi:membrane fusion protein (multidrug efflux system)
MLHVTRAAILAVPAALALCLPGDLRAQDARTAAVTVVIVRPETVTLTTTLPGRVVASAVSEVRPQVAGIITERLFDEGGSVEAGEALYTIDPATYEAAVAQASASVSAAEAQLRAAERDQARAETLLSRSVGTQQTVDDAITAREGAAAQLLVAKAQLQSAQIELDRTTIRARLSGEIGRSLTSRGALVTTGQAEPLAVIRNIDPVFVDVTQSAAELLQWRRDNAGTGQEDGDRTVKLILADGSEYEQTGTLTAAEPQVDERTGVVVLRMEFDNPDKLLLPGMYVQVVMPTTKAEGVYLVPQEGVSRDRRGRPLALVVNSENVVESREIDTVEDRGADWVVGSGLEPGDRVMVEGFQKAAPGATVTPEERQETSKGDAEPQPETAKD